MLVGALLALPGAADSHQQSLSFSELRVRGAQVECRVRVSALDLGTVMLLDQDGDGHLTAAEVQAVAPAIAKATLGELRLRSAGADCPLALAQSAVTLEDEDGLLAAGRFDCPSAVERLEVRVGLLEILPAGHTHLAKILFEDGSGDTSERVAQAGSESFSIERRQSTSRAALRFFLLGIEHIFTGYDHIAFLIGLLLLGGSLGTLVKIVTSFTVAHSITLALAALELVVPPSRLIEPLIAASIVYVAAENLWALRRARAGVAASAGGDAQARSAQAASARALSHRWMLTFAFGLVHGFGFAGALRELHLPRASLAASLVTFNLGVETGQICIVALAVPLFALLRRRGFAPQGVRALSAAIGCLGLFWFCQRLLSAG